MDTLVRLKLKPLGVWTTPWHADTVMGALASVWARRKGTDALRREFLDPWLASEPLFVISDAFPGEYLPAPACLPIWWDWPAAERKGIKQVRWLDAEDFTAIQKGSKPQGVPYLDDSPRVSIEEGVRLRNSISRVSDTTGEGGELFEVPFSSLSDSDAGLTIFARTDDGKGLPILTEAIEMLGQTGYGADASVGHGGFVLDGDPVPCAELDDVAGADGFVSLSTFQPAAADPVDGLWRAFVKYGKLAPDFHNIAVFKRPQVMLSAGACFHTQRAPKPFYGGPVGPERLLDDGARKSLADIGVHPVQSAFALAVPMIWREESD